MHFPQIPVGTHLAGKYRVTLCIEETDTYRTYLGRDSLETRTWMLRQLATPTDEAARREFSKWFYDEGERQVELKHPQLPSVNEFFMERGSAWTVTEQLETPSIDFVVRAHEGPIDEAQARAWLLSLAMMMQFLHEQPVPIVLGGFNPRALALLDEDHVRLLDYGVRRVFPPEDGAGLSRRDDIFSIGRIGCLILTLDPDSPDVAAARPDISRELVDIIDRCLGRGEHPRFESSAELVSWLTGHAQEVERNPPRPSARPPSLEFVQDDSSVLISAFNVVNEGSGIVTGEAQSAAPWLKVSPAVFEGNDSEIQVWIDVNRLPETPVVESKVQVTTPYGNLEVPVRVETAAGRVRPLQVWTARLGTLLIGAIGAGVLIWQQNEVVIAADVLASSVGLRPGMPGIEAVMAQARRMVQLELLLVAIIPLVTYAILHALPALLKSRVRFFAALGMLAPAVVPWVVFRDVTVRLAPSASEAFQRIDPHFADTPMLLTGVILTFLLAVSPERMPGLLGNPSLRLLAVAAVLLLHFRTYFQIGM